MRSVSLLLAIALGALPSLQDVGRETTDQTVDQLPPRTSVLTPLGQTTNSAAGQAGVRQRQDAVIGIDPMARIDNRIRNRVQSRIRNRIDRNYDPRSNATSPFRVADQANERAAQGPR